MDSTVVVAVMLMKKTRVAIIIQFELYTTERQPNEDKAVERK